MSIGAHGFAGFSPRQAGEWSRSNWAIYTDLEADVIESLTLGFALRYEDFQDFGDTINGKLAGRWAITDTFAIRGSVSTGFRAPTPGQANVTKVSTVTDDDGELIQSGQIPPTNPVAQLVRWMTPQARTEDEKPFRLKDLRQVRRHFDCTMYYEQFFSVAAGLLSRALVSPPPNLLTWAAYGLDRTLDLALPPLRPLFRQVLIEGRPHTR